jgi:hypothetical protein
MKPQSWAPLRAIKRLLEKLRPNPNFTHTLYIEKLAGHTLAYEPRKCDIHLVRRAVPLRDSVRPVSGSTLDDPAWNWRHQPADATNHAKAKLEGSSDSQRNTSLHYEGQSHRDTVTFSHFNWSDMNRDLAVEWNLGVSNMRVTGSDLNSQSTEVRKIAAFWRWHGMCISLDVWPHTAYL